MEQLLLQKLKEIDTNKRFIVGVDGLSRSGKTTIVRSIESYLKKINRPYYIFHIDDHIVLRDKRYCTGHEQWYEYYALQWDTQWLKLNFFMRLREGNFVELPFYDDTKDQHAMKSIELPENCIVIVEGVFLQRKEWRQFYDYIVFLDCPREVRFKRESPKTQENILKFQERYWKAEDYYLLNEQPLVRANLVIKS